MASMDNIVVQERGEAARILSRLSSTACLRCREQKVMLHDKDLECGLRLQRITLSSGVGANVPYAVDVLDLMQHVIIPTLQIDGAHEVNEMAPGYRNGRANVIENRLTLGVSFLSVLTTDQACNRIPLTDRMRHRDIGLRAPTAIIFLDK
jgi:hypothetical protein